MSLVGDFFDHYFEIVSDPAHMAAEITFMLILDVVFLGLMWPLMKMAVKRTVEKRVMAEHHTIDVEHGVKDHGVHASTTAAAPTETASQSQESQPTTVYEPGPVPGLKPSEQPAPTDLTPVQSDSGFC